MEGTNVFSTNFDYSNGIGSADFPKQPSQFTSSIKFHNYLNVPIYIGTRDGLVYRLKPINDGKAKEFLYIEREIHLTTSQNDFIDKHYHSKGDEGIFSGVVEHGPNVQLSKYKFIRIFNTVEHSDLLSADALYFEAIDYVISLSPTGWTHPNVQSKFHNGKTRYNCGNEAETSIKFELVDHNNYYGTSFINVNGFVHKVVPTNKTNRDQGLYVYFNSIMKDGKFRNEDVILIPIEKIKDSSWKLYPSYSDAAILGDYKRQKEDLREELKLEREEEILKLKHEVEIAKQETASIKEEHRRKEAEDELVRIQREKDFAEIKRSMTSEQERWAREKADLLHQQQMERSRLEHELNMRSSYRKDSSEALKWILGITGTVLSITAMIMSQRKD